MNMNVKALAAEEAMALYQQGVSNSKPVIQNSTVSLIR